MCSHLLSGQKMVLPELAIYMHFELQICTHVPIDDIRNYYPTVIFFFSFVMPSGPPNLAVRMWWCRLIADINHSSSSSVQFDDLFRFWMRSVTNSSIKESLLADTSILSEKDTQKNH